MLKVHFYKTYKFLKTKKKNLEKANISIQSKIISLKHLKPIHQHIQHIKQHPKTKYRSEYSTHFFGLMN